MTGTSLYGRVWLAVAVAVVLAGVSLAAGAALSPSGQAAAQQGQGGRYVPLSSARLLDARVTTPERPAAPLAGYQSVDIQVAGKGGVPATGALGAAVTVTVVPRDGLAGHGRVWPAGEARPTPASNINWGNGEWTSNAVVSKIGANGKVSFYTNQSTTDVIIDVNGYYAAATTGGYVPLSQARVVDTRNRSGRRLRRHRRELECQLPRHRYRRRARHRCVGGGAQPVRHAGHGVQLRHGVAQGRDPALCVERVVQPNESRSALVMAKVSPDGWVSVYNAAGNVHVVLDVAGYEMAGSATTYFPVTAKRPWARGPTAPPPAPLPRPGAAATTRQATRPPSKTARPPGSRRGPHL